MDQNANWVSVAFVAHWAVRSQPRHNLMESSWRDQVPALPQEEWTSWGQLRKHARLGELMSIRANDRFFIPQVGEEAELLAVLDVWGELSYKLVVERQLHCMRCVVRQFIPHEVNMVAPHIWQTVTCQVAALVSPVAKVLHLNFSM